MAVHVLVARSRSRFHKSISFVKERMQFSPEHFADTKMQKNYWASYLRRRCSEDLVKWRKVLPRCMHHIYDQCVTTPFLFCISCKLSSWRKVFPRLDCSTSSVTSQIFLGRDNHARRLVRLSALMNLYMYPLYVLVSKIFSSILNSSALIHPLYHPLSTLSTVGPTYHFI
jgi:hypothetical protein